MAAPTRQKIFLITIAFHSACKATRQKAGCCVRTARSGPYASRATWPAATARRCRNGQSPALVWPDARNTREDLLDNNGLALGLQGNRAKGGRLRQNGQIRAIRVKGTLACSDGSVLHQWSLAGIGLAERSLWEVREDIVQGRLVPVP